MLRFCLLLQILFFVACGSALASDYYIWDGQSLQKANDDPAKIQPDHWYIEVFPRDVPATFDNWQAMKGWGGIKGATAAEAMEQLQENQQREDDAAALSRHEAYYTYHNYLGPIAILKRKKTPTLDDALKSAAQSHNPNIGALFDPNMSGFRIAAGDGFPEISKKVDEWIQQFQDIKSLIDILRGAIHGEQNPFSGVGDVMGDMIGPYLDALGKLRKLRSMIDANTLDGIGQINSVLDSVASDANLITSSAGKYGTEGGGADDSKAAKAIADAVKSSPSFPFFGGTASVSAESSGGQITVSIRAKANDGADLLSFSSSADLKNVTSVTVSNDGPLPGVLISFQDGAVTTTYSGPDSFGSLFKSALASSIIILADPNRPHSYDGLKETISKLIDAHSGSGGGGLSEGLQKSLKGLNAFKLIERPAATPAGSTAPNLPGPINALNRKLLDAKKSGAASLQGIFSPRVSVHGSGSASALSGHLATGSDSGTQVAGWTSMGDGYAMLVKTRGTGLKAGELVATFLLLTMDSTGNVTDVTVQDGGSDVKMDEVLSVRIPRSDSKAGSGAGPLDAAATATKIAELIGQIKPVKVKRIKDFYRATADGSSFTVYMMRIVTVLYHPDEEEPEVERQHAVVNLTDQNLELRRKSDDGKPYLLLAGDNLTISLEFDSSEKDLCDQIEALLKPFMRKEGCVTG